MTKVVLARLVRRIRFMSFIQTHHYFRLCVNSLHSSRESVPIAVIPAQAVIQTRGRWGSNCDLFDYAHRADPTRVDPGVGVRGRSTSTIEGGLPPSGEVSRCAKGKRLDAFVKHMFIGSILPTSS